ncbi:MAG: radical SAM protein [Alphaproteobacteria bacterium]|nr:radical SAM protein [Alphaproteobacteria bacterium]
MFHTAVKSQEEFIKHLETRFTWGPFLKITNLCNNFCPHCCERSGPNCDPKFIELSDLKHILQDFKHIKNFSNAVTITGGEPTMAYTAKSRHYIPQLLKYCGKNKYDVYFNTNARWTLSDQADMIYSDFEEFIKSNKQMLAFRLSLDKYHTDALNANATFANWILKNKTINQNRTHLYMWHDSSEILQEFYTILQNKFNITPPQEIGTIGGNTCCKFPESNKLICTMPYQGITNMGRAKDNKIATKEPFSKETLYLSPFIDPNNDICFDSNGYAILNANDNDTIKTEYCDKNGKIKNINQIKQELFNIAYYYYLMEQQH